MDKELEEIYKECLKGKTTSKSYTVYYSGRRHTQLLYVLFVRTMRQLVEINKKFNHSKQSNYKKLESIVCSAFNKYDYIKQMRDIQAQIYVDIMFKHPFLDGNKRTALYWIYKLTHDYYDKFDEYTFKGIIEALGDK